jgi:hypothetical protein
MPGRHAPRPHHVLDDLRGAFPGAIDPLRFMPKARAWMADGRRYTQMFVADPSCCPSRASLMRDWPGGRSWRSTRRRGGWDRP